MNARAGYSKHAGRLSVVLLGLIMALPLIWLFLGAFKDSNASIFLTPFSWPAGWKFSNFAAAWSEGSLGNGLWNSFLLTLFSTLGTVVLGLWLGHGLARNLIPFPNLWLLALPIGLALPVQAYFIPLLDILRLLHLHDTLLGLMGSHIAQNLPLAAMLFRAWFVQQPRDIEEAASLDGVPAAQLYWQILLPCARPVATTVAILTALNVWNEFILALVVVNDPLRRVMPTSMIAFEQAHSTNYPALLAGLALLSVPPLIALAILNRQIVQGVMRGAIK